MMCTPATPGMVASSSISSTQMRTPSRAGSAACFHARDQRLGDDGAVEVVFHPMRRLGRAQRIDADQDGELPREPGVGSAPT